MSLCVGESPTGCLTIVGTSCLEEGYYTKYNLPIGLHSLSTMALIWVAPLVSFSFALLWIPGTTTFIKSQGSLLTGVIWMITPQAVQALNGFSMHKPYFKNFLMRVLSSFHITVTPLNLYPHLLTKLPVFYPASPSPMASPLLGLLCHPFSDLHTCASVRDHVVSYFILHFFLFPLILHAKSILIFFLTSILQHVNVSAKLFSSRILLSLPPTFPYLTPPLGGAKLSFLPPLCQPTPLYDDQMSLLPPSPPFTRSAIEAAQLRKPIAAMQKRTRACTALGLSFRDRTIFLSFYVLSLPVYHHSTLQPSSPFYRIYFTLIRRLLAPRHWIQASQLPGNCYLPPPWHPSLPPHSPHMLSTRLLFTLLR